MRSLLLICILGAISVMPAFSETVSVVLTDVPHRQFVPMDFQCQFDNITSVEITMTSNMGEVHVCGEDPGGGSWSYPCGNRTRFRIGEDVFMAVNGFGEINQQTWNVWKWFSAPNDPVTDWSFLNSGVTTFHLQCFGDGCSPDWIRGEGFCGPYPYQVDEIKISVTAGTVATKSSAWGQIKAIYR